MVVASFYTITFKSEDNDDFTTQASLGCIRKGGVADILDLYRRAQGNLQVAINHGDAVDGAQYQSVIFRSPEGGQQEYAMSDIQNMLAQTSSSWVQEEDDENDEGSITPVHRPGPNGPGF